MSFIMERAKIRCVLPILVWFHYVPKSDAFFMLFVSKMVSWVAKTRSPITKIQLIIVYVISTIQDICHSVLFHSEGTS